MKQVTLPTPIAFGASASTVSVNRVNVAQDDSGDWQIGARLDTTQPERADVAGLRLNERHNAQAQITVTRAEIAAQAGIAGEDVRTTLTLEQTETIVTTVAMGKLLAAYA